VRAGIRLGVVVNGLVYALDCGRTGLVPGRLVWIYGEEQVIE